MDYNAIAQDREQKKRPAFITSMWGSWKAQTVSSLSPVSAPTVKTLVQQRQSIHSHCCKSSHEHTTNNSPLGTGRVLVLNSNSHKHLGTRESRQAKRNIKTSSRELIGCEKSYPCFKSQKGAITLGITSKLSEKSNAGYSVY